MAAEFRLEAVAILAVRLVDGDVDVGVCEDFGVTTEAP